MLESYSPYQQFTLKHALLRRELSHIRWEHDPAHLPYFSFEVGAGLLGAQMIVVALVAWFLALVLGQTHPADVPFATGIILGLLHVGVSVGVDVYTLYNAIHLWQSRSQREHWDALRLTLPTDEALIEMYAGLAELKSWRALYADTTLRFSLSIIMGMTAAAMVLVFFQLTGSDATERTILLIGGIVLLTAFTLVYTRAPLWRFRTTVMLGLLVAESSHDMTAAIFAGLAGVLALRLMVIAAMLAVLQIALMAHAVADGLLVSGLLVGMAASAYWLTRPAYVRLRDWLQQRLVLRMRDQ